MSIVPIFLLSLPRSGSTLLQRLIATHPRVATTSEPWFLLPLFLAFRDGHVFTSYQQRFFVRAFTDFLDQLPDGPAAYRTAVRRFGETLYTQACDPDHTHFLDKTPRYHLLAPDLLETFPEARGIVLWRNPLSIAASCINEDHAKRWNLYLFRLDLFHGLSNLLELQRHYPDRLFFLRYEDLVEHPNRYVQAIFHDLGLPPTDDVTVQYRQVPLRGTMGDKKGEQIFSGVSTASRDAWRETLTTPLRRVWARRYLHWIGRGRLAEMGYNLDDLQTQLSVLPLTWRHALSDLCRMCYGRYAVASEPWLFRKKRALATRGIGIDVLSE